MGSLQLNLLKQYNGERIMALTKIKTSGIADNAITNAKMADDAIDSADFANANIYSK